MQFLLFLSSISQKTIKKNFKTRETQEKFTKKMLLVMYSAIDEPKYFLKCLQKFIM